LTAAYAEGVGEFQPGVDALRGNPGRKRKVFNLERVS